MTTILTSGKGWEKKLKNWLNWENQKKNNNKNQTVKKNWLEFKKTDWFGSVLVL
jgi:hypothetical protein